MVVNIQNVFCSLDCYVLLGLLEILGTRLLQLLM